MRRWYSYSVTWVEVPSPLWMMLADSLSTNIFSNITSLKHSTKSYTPLTLYQCLTFKAHNSVTTQYTVYGRLGMFEIL